jgi:hypothetical protein
MRSLVLASLTVLALLFAGCGGSGKPASNSPDPYNEKKVDESAYGIPLRPGDYWVQRAYFEDAPDETAATIDYYAEAPQDFDGETALRLVSSDGTRILWIRITDGALLQEANNGTSHTYDPPCVGFALAPNADSTFDHACHRLGTRNPTGVASSDAPLATKANGTKSISVPAGAFDTIQLETRQGGEFLGREFWAPNACFPVRVVTADGERTIILDLVTFKCTKGNATT